MGSKAADAEEKRQEMMGIGELRPNSFQRRLRTIIMCAPIIRKVPHYLARKQENYLDLRAQFVIAQDPAKVEKVGKAIVAIDNELAAKQLSSEQKKKSPRRGSKFFRKARDSRGIVPQVLIPVSRNTACACSRTSA